MWESRESGAEDERCKCGNRHQKCGCKLITNDSGDWLHNMCSKHMRQCHMEDGEEHEQFYAFKTEVMENVYGKGHGRKIRSEVQL